MSPLFYLIKSYFPLSFITALLLIVMIVCGLSSSPILRRLPMQYRANRECETYSHTDNQVRFIARFCLLTGCVCGGIIVGAIMSALNS